MPGKPEIVPSTASERIEAGLPPVEIADVPSENVIDPNDWDAAEDGLLEGDPPATMPAGVDATPPVVPATEPVTAEVPAEEGLDYKGLVETMDREMAANPVNLLTNLAKTANMTETQVLELVRSLAPSTEEKFLPDGYEPQGLLEPELVKRDRMDWIFKGEEKVNKIVEGAVGDAAAKMAPYIDGANQEVAIQQAIINGLCEAIGLNVQPDRKAIQAEVSKGTPFADAVNKVMGAQIKSEVAKAKQAGVARPDTPGGGGNDLMERKPGMPMTSYLNALKNGVKIG